MYKRFLDDLWGGMDQGHILIWLYDGDAKKESHWHKDAGSAAACVEAATQQKINVYMGVGLSPRSYGINQRCLKKDIMGIGGLWLDMDIMAPEHSKPNLPATHDDAIDLLAELPLEPSYVINSGHGLQVWWMFKEPWYFNTPHERADAELLEKRLNYFFKGKAQERGWDVDSIYNLDRVMRIPGGVNYKSMPKPVTVISRNAVDYTDDGDVCRYNPADFEEFLPELAPETHGADNRRSEGIKINLSAKANPPFDKFQLLSEVEPRFVAAWNLDRKDMQDQSMSSYDMALARYACMAGWTAQEVADLIIAFRRKHGADLKLRLDYYQRTIARAQIGIEQREALESIEAHTQSQAAEDAAPSDPNTKDALLQSLSAVMGVHMVRIKKYIADPPMYKLQTSRGEITLGEVQNLIKQNALRDKIAAVAGVHIPRFKGEQWDSIAQALLDCCMEIALDESASETGEAREWLEMYLDSRPPMARGESEEAALQQSPVDFDDAHVAIFGMDFRRWLRATQQEKITGKKMGIILRSVGGRASKISFEKDGKPTSRSVWILPKNFNG